VCKRASGRLTRHQAVNDIVSRAFVAARVPMSKKPVSLCGSDGKCPDVSVEAVPEFGSQNQISHGDDH